MAPKIKNPATLLRKAAAIYAADPKPCGWWLLEYDPKGEKHCCALGSLYLAAGVPECELGGKGYLYSWRKITFSSVVVRGVVDTAEEFLNAAAEELYGKRVDEVNDHARTFKARHNRIGKVFARAIELAKAAR